MSAQTAGPRHGNQCGRERLRAGRAIVLCGCAARNRSRVSARHRRRSREATARESEAQMRYDRIRDMYSRQVVAKATLDEATAARDAAAARLVRRGPAGCRPGRRVLH